MRVWQKGLTESFIDISSERFLLRIFCDVTDAVAYFRLSYSTFEEETDPYISSPGVIYGYEADANAKGE